MEIDEFEFRPITDGLGFHRKPNPLKTDAEKSGVLESIKSPIQQAASLSAQLGLDVPAASPTQTEFLEDKAPTVKSPWGEPVVRKPLPRPGDERKNGPTHSTMAVTSAVARAASALSGSPTAILSQPIRNPVVQPQAAPTVARAHVRGTGFSWSAAFVDLVMVVATTLVFLVSLLIVTDVDLVNLLNKESLGVMPMVSLAVLFFAVVQIYMVGLRGYAGLTLGDWAFDTQVGTSPQQQHWSFPLKLLGRSLLYTVTGFVVLPLFATFMRKDLAGTATGLTLTPRE